MNPDPFDYVMFKCQWPDPNNLPKIFGLAAKDESVPDLEKVCTKIYQKISVSRAAT
jgi:hypothetical protein